MIGSWMAYAVLLAALFGGVALAAEQAARLYRLPTRWIWAGAMALSLGVPGTLLVTPSSAPNSASPALLPTPQLFVSAAEPRPAPPPISVVSAPVLPLTERLNPFLLAGWGLGSLLLLGVGFRAHRRLSRARRGWRRGQVADTRVWLSRRIGPAVVGVLRPEIVLPERVLGWDGQAQRLVVEHEREHLRAGDPRLLALGWLAVVLVPWNPALWWQLRRLRLATETDCDARVLRHRPDVRRYGALLLEVGRLASGVPVTAVTFSEPRSFLERRIYAMTAPRARRRFRSVLLSGALCALGFVSAAAVPVPDRPELEAWEPYSSHDGDLSTEAAVAVPSPAQGTLDEDSFLVETSAPPKRTRLAEANTPADTTRPHILNFDEVKESLDRNHSPLLPDAAVSGSVLLSLYIDPQGRVTEVRVVDATHPELGAVAKRALQQAWFSPATVEGHAVPFRLPMTILFTDPSEGVEVFTIPSGNAKRAPVPVSLPSGDSTRPQIISCQANRCTPLSLPSNGEEREGVWLQGEPSIRIIPVPAAGETAIFEDGSTVIRVQPREPEMRVRLETVRAATQAAAAQAAAARAAMVRERTEAVRARSEEIRRLSEANRKQMEKAREQIEQHTVQMKRHQEQMERRRSRRERVSAAVRSALERHHPTIAARGTGGDTYVWFMVDGEDRVLTSGTHPLTLGPAERFGGRGAWHTSTVEEELSSAYPRVRIENVTITRGPIDGKPMNVARVTLKPGSPAP